MDLAVILVPIFVFVLLKIVLDHRAQARSDNVRLLEEALKSPQVDRQILENLTFQLTGNRPIREQGPGKLLALILAAGWMALFVGIGLWISGSMSRRTDLVGSGIIVAVIGFGLVTYPFALRELESRKQA
ncbi:MAG: hypothetical protein MUC36_01910 [Planctomycetes bacterium]|jgi:hypothetical protein|nr:hypothetical protein [Planctomycetota bacterium]